jgi:hypothetical protein
MPSAANGRDQIGADVTSQYVCWRLHVNAAQQPNYQQDYKQGAKHSAESRAAISVVAVISTTAEQQDKTYDDDK